MKNYYLLLPILLTTACSYFEKLPSSSLPSTASITEQTLPDAEDVNVAQAVDAGTDLYKAATLSDAEVAAIADSAIVHLDREHTIAEPESELARRMQRIVAQHSRIDTVALDVQVYTDTEANAFAFANGSIRVYAGLMDMMTDDELRGIIGHEIGHIQLGHSKKQLQRAHAATAAIKGGMLGVGSGTEALAASIAGAIAEAVLEAQFSQVEEMEADTYGLSFLAKNGYPLNSLSSALKKLSLLEQSYSFLDSHPSPDERIIALQPQIDSFNKMLATTEDSDKVEQGTTPPVGTFTAKKQLSNPAAVVPEPAESNESINAGSTPAARVLLETSEREVQQAGQPDTPRPSRSYSDSEILASLPKIRTGWYVLSEPFESKFDAELQALDMPASATDFSIVQLSGSEGRMFHVLVGPFYKEEYARKNVTQLQQAGAISDAAVVFYIKGTVDKTPTSKAKG